MLDKINTNVIFAGAIAFATYLVLNLLALFTAEGSNLNSFIQGIGGTPTGIIQFLCVWLFTYTWLELRHKKRQLEAEQLGFSDDFLPRQEHLVLNADEVAEIKLQVIKKERMDGQRGLVRALIKQVCNQYRNQNSVVEAYQALEHQIKSTKQLEEAKLEFTRYTMRAIESLGLIGTLIGMTQAISKSSGMFQIDIEAKQHSLLGIINSFSMAFGTTLVAIVLGLILAQFYHAYLSKLDTFTAEAEKYIIDNLISRIYEHQHQH
jgi:biopolymer transport protein ExbB/TolQ